MLLPVQDRAHAYVGCSLLRGDPVILARSHRKLMQSVLLRELPQTPEVRTRRLRIGRLWRHRHQASNVFVEVEKPTKLLRLDPGLRGLAGEIHLQESGDGEPPCRRLRVE